MRKMAKVWIVASVVSALGANAWAAESVTPELDKCINQKKISYTAKGAVAGALMGFLSAKASGKNKEDHAQSKLRRCGGRVQL